MLRGRPHTFGSIWAGFAGGAVTSAAGAAGAAGGTGTASAAGASAAQAASAEARTVMLGLRDANLQSYADDLGYLTLLDDPAWISTLNSAVGNPAARLAVSLDGFSGAGTYNQVMSAAQRAATGAGSATDMEMALLYEAGRLGDVLFYRGGVAVANPFG